MKIIIVDDEKRWRDLFCDRVDEALKDLTISIDKITFSSYDTAADALLKNSPWHLMITDYSLDTEKEFDSFGAELCHKANQFGVPSIVITGQPKVTVDDVRDLFIKYNIIDFFTKIRLNREELIKTIKKEIKKSNNAQETIINHFDQNFGDNEVIKPFINKSNSRQLYEICNILEILNPPDESELNLNEYLDSTKRVFKAIQEKLENQNNFQMAGAVKNFTEIVERQDVDIKQTIKLTVPIIPFFLTYKMELDHNTKVELEGLWKRIIDRVKCTF